MIYLLLGIITFLTTAFISSQTQFLLKFSYDYSRWITLLVASYLIIQKIRKLLSPRSLSICIVTLTVLWARLHNAPTIQEPTFAEVIHSRSGTSDVSRELIIRDSTSKFYQIRGRAKTGDKGQVVCRKFCYFKPNQTVLSAEDMSHHFRAFFRKCIEKLPPGMHSWSYALILGDKSLLETEQKQAFKGLGMYHLLVISGLHISYIGAALLTLVQSSIIPFYSMKLIRPTIIPYVSSSIKILCIIAVVLFCYTLGFPVSAQRAAFIFITANIGKAIGIKIKQSSMIVFAVTLQILLFPEGVWGISSALSWGAYLIFSRTENSPKKNVLEATKKILETYWFLFLWIYAFLNQIVPLAIIFNLILLPIFSPLFILLFVAILLPPGHFAVWEIFFHIEGFGFVVQYYYNLIATPIEVLIDGLSIPPYLRGISLWWALTILIKRYNINLPSIRRKKHG